jgi:hypothetical protein
MIQLASKPVGEHLVSSEVFLTCKCSGKRLGWTPPRPSGTVQSPLGCWCLRSHWARFRPHRTPYWIVPTHSSLLVHLLIILQSQHVLSQLYLELVSSTLEYFRCVSAVYCPLALSRAWSASFKGVPKSSRLFIMLDQAINTPICGASFNPPTLSSGRGVVTSSNEPQLQSPAPPTASESPG